MITKKTVFVLGAGSSAAYGFPTGGQLLTRARKMPIDEMMFICGDQVRHVHAMQAALKGTAMSSIDAMLENRPELWPALKRVIAALLIEAEYEVAGSELVVEEDWIALVIERMVKGAKSLPEFVASNRIAFVTFNYDRFLEYRLARGVSEHYGVSEDEVWKFLADIPIIHLHGSLGPLPNLVTPARELEFPFGFQSETYDFPSIAAKRAESNIKIVHDATAADEPFVKALSLLQSAQRVLFLGFSFGTENVDHLQVNRIFKETEIYCTTYGMKDAEVDDAIDPAFGGRSLLFKRDMKIKDFLRNHIHLLK